MATTLDLSGDSGIQSELTTSYTEQATTLIAPSATLSTGGSDSSSSIDRMTVVLSGATASESLSLDWIGALTAFFSGITVSYNTATGTLTLSETWDHSTSNSIWSALLQHVQYTNSSNTPRTEGVTLTITASNTDPHPDHSVSGVVTMNVAAANDAPTTLPVDLGAFAEDGGSLTITAAELLANAVDVDGDTLTVSDLQIASGNGSLVDNNDGTWSYTPAANDDTSVSFGYTIGDGVDSVAASATLDITPVIDAPTLTVDPLIDSVDVGSVSYTIAGLEAGATAVVTFSDGVNPDVVSVVLGADGAYSIDLSGLNDGPITSSVTVTNGGDSQSFGGQGSLINTSTSLTMNLDSWIAYGATQAASNGAFSTITIASKGKYLQALSASDIATLGAQGVTSIDSKTDHLRLTVEQYDAFLAAGIAFTDADFVTLRDSGANLATVLGSDLAGNGVDKLDAADDALSLSVEQYLGLGGVQLTLADTVTLADDGADIAALSVAELGGLAAGGIDRIDASGALSLSLAQFNALGDVMVAASTALTVTGEASTKQVFDFSRQIFTDNDSIVGGDRNDQLHLKGDYSAGLAFGAGALTSIDQLTVKAGYDYSLTTDDANVAAGAVFRVRGNPLGTGDDLSFDGSAETDGRFKFTGGAGNDTFKGGAGRDVASGGGGTNDLMGGVGADTFYLATGAGADTLSYGGVAESTGPRYYDTVKGFEAEGGDRFDLWDGQTVAGIDAAITTGGLSRGGSFNGNLEAAVNGSNLAANHAVLFTADAGNLAGVTFLVVDINGTAGYQANADLVVRMDNFTGSLSTTNFG